MESEKTILPTQKPLIHFYLKSLDSDQKMELAKKMGVSRSHFYRLCQNPGGISFTQLQIIVPYLELVLGKNVRDTFLENQPQSRAHVRR